MIEVAGIKDTAEQAEESVGKYAGIKIQFVFKV